jgi:hypothetical protein
MIQNDISDRSDSTKNDINDYLVKKDQSWMPCFVVVMFHNDNVQGHDLEIEMWSQDVYA